MKKDTTANIARVRPVEDNICDFRAIDPNPGIRAFGAFVEMDTFVALTWRYREDLGYDPRKWAAEIGRCKAKWRNLFHNYPRPTGSFNDLLSNFQPV